MNVRVLSISGEKEFDGLVPIERILSEARPSRMTAIFNFRGSLYRMDLTRLRMEE